ncbi:MAG TPA: hypothetical protein VE258_13020, partial [Ktedonobacterales bacterium]|nr:hypothetical protein [Ktedonobacterales bacterium]
ERKRQRMTHSVIAALLLALAAAAVDARAESADASHAPNAPGLAEIMIMTQIRHAKLWLAGDAGNWDLADYEIDELKEGLEDVLKYVPTYKNMPVGQMLEAAIMPAIGAVESAIKARDRARFVAAYNDLTAACSAAFSPNHIRPSTSLCLRK